VPSGLILVVPLGHRDCRGCGEPQARICPETRTSPRSGNISSLRSSWHRMLLERFSSFLPVCLERLRALFTDRRPRAGVWSHLARAVAHCCKETASHGRLPRGGTEHEVLGELRFQFWQALRGSGPKVAGSKDTGNRMQCRAPWIQGRDWPGQGLRSSAILPKCASIMKLTGRLA
jgi:hypothetical protein